MLSLFSRRPRLAPPVRRARLSLESLDGRDLPSAPVISNFQVTQTSNGVYEVSGTVSDADQSPDGLTITFGGGLDGIDGHTTVTVAGGSFWVTLTVTSYESGCITATTKDADNNVSNEVYKMIDPTPPPARSGTSYETASS